MRNCRAVMVLLLAIVTAPLLAISQSADTQQSAPSGTASADAAQPRETIVAPEEQATKEQIARLFEVMRLRKQMDTVMQALGTSITQQVQQQTRQMISNLPDNKKITPKEMEAIEQFQKKWMDRALHMVPYDDFIGDLEDVWQSHVTKTDVDAVIAFYSSTAGQHLLDEQPVIMKEYMPRVMARVNDRSKQLTDEMMKDMAELTKELEPPAKAPAAKKTTPAPQK